MDQKDQNGDDLVYKTMPQGHRVFFERVPKNQPVKQSFLTQTTPLEETVRPDQTFSMPEDKPRSSFLKSASVTAAAAILILAGFWGYNNYKKKSPAKLRVSTNNQNENPVSLISKEWREKYFNAGVCLNEDNCGDNSDPDHDGLTNVEEYNALTDPNNPDSDLDGLSDGDEKHVFGYDPRNPVSSGNEKYKDIDEAKTKWNVKEKRFFNDDELKNIASAIQKYGLHTPTITTLDKDLITFYSNYGQNATSKTSAQSDPAALDRDSQRDDAIKQISFALLKYKQAGGKYPNTNSFSDMLKAVQASLTGRAINTSDPKNTPPYVYSYAAVSSGADFKLSYFSETQNQLITLNAKAASALYVKDQALQRDNQRKADLDQISSALGLYSSDNVKDNNADSSVYPSQATWKEDLKKGYLTTIPTDPVTKQDYSYSVSPNRDSFALQANLEVPPSGKKGYLCTADGCVFN